jgi:hypothetical protein
MSPINLKEESLLITSDMSWWQNNRAWDDETCPVFVTCVVSESSEREMLFIIM